MVALSKIEKTSKHLKDFVKSPVRSTKFCDGSVLQLRPFLSVRQSPSCLSALTTMLSFYLRRSHADQGIILTRFEGWRGWEDYYGNIY